MFLATSVTSPLPHKLELKPPQIDMALQAVYKQFLAAPNSSALAQNASLHYITTLSSFYGPTDIIKHLNSTRNQINKKKEELLNVVEGQNALAVQAELTLEFQESGGPYLPGLDDQFLSDRIVHLPVVSKTPLPPSLSASACQISSWIDVGSIQVITARLTWFIFFPL